MATIITRQAGIALFTALGITAASKWSAKRMAAKLAAVNEMVDDDTNIEDPATDATLTNVLTAIENKDEIQVVKTAEDKAKAEAKAEAKDAADSVPVKTETAAAKKKRVAKEKREAKKAAEAATAEKETEATEAPAETATEAPAPAPAPKTPAAKKFPGIRDIKSRAYCAGVVLARHTRSEGVTVEMAAEVNELYGRENTPESMGRLKNVWHGLGGYHAEKKGKTK